MHNYEAPDSTDNFFIIKLKSVNNKLGVYKKMFIIKDVTQDRFLRAIFSRTKTSRKKLFF